MKLITLVYRIEVQVRLLVLKRNSYLPGLVLVWRCITFEDFFALHIYDFKEIQYLLKIASLWHSNFFTIDI